MTEEDAKKMIVNGFISPIIRELPLEYAAEMNILIGMELEGGF
jgi:Fe-S cluster assembly protein SufB